jgi:hypothetical protein
MVCCFQQYPTWTGDWLFDTATEEDVAGWLKNLTGKLGVDLGATTNITDYYLTPNRTFNVLVPRFPGDLVGSGQGSLAAMVEISSGVLFQCPVRRLLGFQAGAGQPAYGYSFGYASVDNFFGSNNLTYNFAGHGNNVVFSGTDPITNTENPVDAGVARAMQQYFISVSPRGSHQHLPPQRFL